jgi:hypothetical protein
MRPPKRIEVVVFIPIRKGNRFPALSYVIRAEGGEFKPTRRGNAGKAVADILRVHRMRIVEMTSKKLILRGRIGDKELATLRELEDHE